MRLHPVTRGAVNAIITNYKKMGAANYSEDEEKKEEEEKEEVDSLFYYGLVMSETSVVTIFKSNPDIAVAPQDINLLMNYDQL